MADDGGSSGRLRRDMGLPPPGDIRNCLVALADDESLMSRLFQYRFADGGPRGSQLRQPVRRRARRGHRRLRARRVRVDPRAEGARTRAAGDARRRRAARAARRRGPGQRREHRSPPPTGCRGAYGSRPEQPHALPQAVEAVLHADMVVLGPGSLYTSVVPNLLIPAVRDALERTRAWVVYVCNVMTEPGRDGRLHGRRSPRGPLPARHRRHGRRRPRQRQPRDR